MSPLRRLLSRSRALPLLVALLWSGCLSGTAAVEPLPLRDAANRGFRDEAPGDGKGGWTDQGPDNDISTLRPGRLAVHGVSFDVLDPKLNGDRAAIVLGRTGLDLVDQGEERKQAADDAPRGAFTLARATVHADSRRAWKSLYVLHAAAKPPRAPAAVGDLVARYADGTESRHEILNGRDIGDWRDPRAADNAAIAWQGENATAAIGLYVSRFPLQNKALASVSFEHGGEGVWMIAGLSVSDRDIALPAVPRDAFVVTAGPDWAPYEHSLDIARGGVFDFSRHLDAPAGKHGAVRATPSGHFEFEKQPGRRVRFWGVNLCFSAQFLEKKHADLLAERLALSGYNTVRFHHFDRDLVVKGGPSWKLDPAQLDRLDYLFAAMKKRGIYINIDLFSSRGFNAEEAKSFGFPEGKIGYNQFKSILPLDEPAYEAWRRFADNLLTRKNPYTGLTWAEDPALIGICPVNENPLFNRISGKYIRERYDAAFKAAHPREPLDGPAFNRFIHETNARADARMFAHLRGLGVKALLTGANYTIAQGLAYVRQHYDYVDCHSYWDHPKFPGKSWAPPYRFAQNSALAARATMPARMMPTRIFGRPFAVTEFNFCRPNQNRAEGALLMPAYASLQDWDAMYNFQYAMSDDMAINGGVQNYFAIATDPIGLVGDRVGSFVFQRGDIAPGKNAVVYAARPAEAFSSIGRLFPHDFNAVGLVSRIGSFPGEPAEAFAKMPGLAGVVTGAIPAPTGRLPAKTVLSESNLVLKLEREGVLPKGSANADHTRFTSDTGEIELNSAERTFKIVTPRGEHFFAQQGSKLRGERVSVSGVTRRAAISVLAIDPPDSAGKIPGLADARRILVTHLTDALPEGMKFANADRKLLENWGKGPHLLHRGEAELSLRLPAGDWKAWAVDATGARRGEVALTRSGDAHQLKLATVTREGARLAYELARVR
jgi:Cellulase (glycosyl hydrolase family 5).